VPTDVAITTAAIAFVFIVFAAALAWSDYYSNAERRGKKGK